MEKAPISGLDTHNLRPGETSAPSPWGDPHIFHARHHSQEGQGQGQGQGQDQDQNRDHEKGHIRPTSSNHEDAVVDSSPESSTPPPEVDHDDFPDGGRQAWTVVFGAWCTIFTTFGVGNSIGTFQAHYANVALSDYPGSTVAWVTGVMLWTLNFMPVIFGPIYDRYGPQWIIIGGTITYVFGLMMTSLASEFYQFFLAQSIVAGVGASAGAAVAMSSTLSWFNRRRAFAFGVMMSGSSAGGIVLPIMIPKLIESVGFPWMMRIVAFLFLAMLSIACCTVRSRLPPRPRPLVLKEYVSSLGEPVMAATVVAMFFFFWGMFLPYNFIILQAEAQGMSSQMVIYLLPIMHAVSLVGRIIPGILADKYGRYNVMICITALAAVFTLGLWIPSNTNTAIIVFTAAFGFCTGAFTSLSPTLVAQISPISLIGTRTGTAFGVQSIGALTGSPIASAIVESRGGDYLGLKIFCGVCMLASSFVFVLARYLQVGFRVQRV